MNICFLKEGQSERAAWEEGSGPGSSAPDPQNLTLFTKQFRTLPVLKSEHVCPIPSDVTLFPRQQQQTLGVVPAGASLSPGFGK